MARTFYITTAIDYTNGAPHIGHAYEKVLADVIARYQRMKTDADGKRQEVFFLTGVDQHGQKVQQSAEKQGVPPQQFVDGITKKFVALWDKLDVRYDRWAATTDPLHKECVGKILTRLKDEGQLYKAKQGGYYSVRQEQFLTDKERNEQGEFGPEWGEVEFREEENYYFKLGEHKKWLLDLIDKREDFVTPGFRRTELRNAVEKLTGDLCVSRPKSRLAWGIEFPFDPEFVTYVWFDALVNYISFAGYDPKKRDEGRGMRDEKSKAASSQGEKQSAKGGEETSSLIPHPSSFSSLWPPLHVIGKDIMIPAHGVYWPVMLKALGFADDEMPTLLVHGWWNVAGAKMSKSTGNSVDPDALADKYGAETLRYYLMSDIATGRDSDFSEERLVMRYNTDLANSLGNLLNRTLNMAWKYREGRLVQSNEGGLRARAEYFVEVYAPIMGDYSINAGLEKALSLATEANQFVDQTAPWKLAKSPESAAALDAVLYHLAESLRIIAILISPVLPKAALGILDQLDPEGKLSRDFRLADATWGGLKDGHVVGKPVPLFPRIEPPAQP